MTRKLTYDKIASKLNDYLFMGSVSVIHTANHGYGFGKYSITLDDDAYELVKGEFRSPMIVNKFDRTFTIDGNDYYLEPVDSFNYDIAKI